MCKMTVARWNEKATAKLDALLASGKAVCCNLDDGVIFADRSGAWCMHAAGQHGLSSCKKNVHADALAEHYAKAQSMDAVLTDTMQAGTSGGRKARKLSARGIDVFVYETILRQFPQSAMFYLAGPTKPVLVGIWEAGRLEVIGLAMPFIPRSGFAAGA